VCNKPDPLLVVREFNCFLKLGERRGETLRCTPPETNLPKGPGNEPLRTINELIGRKRQPLVSSSEGRHEIVHSSCGTHFFLCFTRFPAGTSPTGNELSRRSALRRGEFVGILLPFFTPVKAESRPTTLHCASRFWMAVGLAAIDFALGALWWGWSQIPVYFRHAIRRWLQAA
jgi:hypothetical protein